ncbi:MULTISPECIES: branched-chain amino acid transaminase [unclassified Rhodanobacter]|jgi:branched-chain amino acid aminotransferase|uniref:branched-chain amino acid transaminase n=1 Tax=unclassified Rhodanobacter TaxID=2621553 RepID=UPI00160BAC5D|nr:MULTISPECIES: branched-chain amino acid transaminase [unclassified Rhodanobacter]MBB6243560.1 branched-chain amino acid aminotransferase [Rhodanobacter sp. MP1X3]MBB6248177.1 branched-chain amino acid aminotransferase [Rhodanobacter sp. A1T4]
MTTPFIWHNGSIKPWAEATVHVSAHALHYGSSVFEGERVYATHRGPAYFRLTDHTHRLFESASMYEIDVGYTEDEINAACIELIRVNQMASAYVRPIVFRGAGALGVLPKDGSPVDVSIMALDWGAYLGDALEVGADVCVSSWNRAAPNTFPSWAKAGGNYLNSQLIAFEARRGGYDEGIALGHNGLLSEGAGENLFLVRKGRLFTPPTSAGILAGITRDTIITLAEDMGLRVEERDMPREALYSADEIFMTGTAAEVTPVRSVDRKPVGKGEPGPITRALQQAFFGLFDGRTEDSRGWLNYVSAPIADREDQEAAIHGRTPHIEPSTKEIAA